MFVTLRVLLYLSRIVDQWSRRGTSRNDQRRAPSTWHHSSTASCWRHTTALQQKCNSVTPAHVCYKSRWDKPAVWRNLGIRMLKGHSFITYAVRTEGGRGSSAMRTPMYCCHSDVIICAYRGRGVGLKSWNLCVCNKWMAPKQMFVQLYNHGYFRQLEITLKFATLHKSAIVAL